MGLHLLAFMHQISCDIYGVLWCFQYFLVTQQAQVAAHNPEVVGSSPASATIKEPGIDTKSVPGLFFICRDISVYFGYIPFIFAQKC